MNAHPNHELLIDYLHGELAPGEDAAFLLHLDECATCRARYQEEVSLSESLREYARATEREFPVGIRAAVLDAIETGADRPTLLERLASVFKPAIAVPIAAALVLAAFLGFGSTAHRNPTIDAGYYLEDHAAVTSAVPFNEGNTVPTALFVTENADGTQ